jgi:O-antigen/teichoic acid export membrane protein
MIEEGHLPISLERRLLVRNTLLNIAGQIAPLVAALIAVPGLLHAVGIERFGVLMLAWLVVGYFSIFDFGLGRALTKLISERQATASRKEIQTLVWSTLAMLATVGFVTGLSLAAAAAWLTDSVLKIPANLQDETTTSFYVLAGAVPFVVTTTALRGVLEAQQRFGAVNAIRIPLGMLNFLGPWLATMHSHELPFLVAVLFALRILAWLAHLMFCSALLRGGGAAGSMQSARALVGLGAWMTISNVVGPVLVYLDRFLVGALVSMAAVTYYATPYEVVTKLWALPAALAGVLFPVFATHVREDAREARRLLTLGIKWVFISVLPVVLVVVVFAFDGLAVWLGMQFAMNSYRVLQLLAVGVLVNCVAQIPFAFLQATGRADVAAKVHLLELVPYVLTAYWLVAHYGITGAAVAWLGRVTVDFLAFFALSRKWLEEGAIAWRRLAAVALATVAILGAGALLESVVAKLLYTLAVLVALALVAWYVALSAGEKHLMRHPLEIFERRDGRLHS